jgi:inosine-uridine nucleoside N-ribohydrolase
MTSTARTLAGWLATLALVAVGCAPTVGASPGAEPTSSVAGPVRPIVIDTDLDHSDIAAILVLLRDPGVDVRAITIAGTGLVHCAGGRLVMRYVLDEMGAADVPVGCGREDGGPDARSFPDDWRAVADTGYGLDIAQNVEPTAPSDAVEILKAAIDASPTPPLIVALGPLTNLEDAFAADPSMVDRVVGVHAMLGTIDEPGNVYVDGLDGDDPLEWNAFADPSAVTAVFATDVPVDLIPLDATADVPVPTDLADRLAGDRASAGADLLHELLVRHPDRMRPDQGQQLWDELAALAVSDSGLVTWQEATVVVGDGGRLTRDAAGRPIRFASAADRALVEAALLDALRRGAARATPFTP